MDLASVPWAKGDGFIQTENGPVFQGAADPRVCFVAEVQQCWSDLESAVGCVWCGEKIPQIPGPGFCCQCLVEKIVPGVNLPEEAFGPHLLGFETAKDQTLALAFSAALYHRATSVQSVIKRANEGVGLRHPQTACKSRKPEQLVKGRVRVWLPYLEAYEYATVFAPIPKENGHINNRNPPLFLFDNAQYALLSTIDKDWYYEPADAPASLKPELGDYIEVPQGTMVRFGQVEAIFAGGDELGVRFNPLGSSISGTDKFQGLSRQSVFRAHIWRPNHESWEPLKRNCDVWAKPLQRRWTPRELPVDDKQDSLVVLMEPAEHREPECEPAAKILRRQQPWTNPTSLSRLEELHKKLCRAVTMHRAPHLVEVGDCDSYAVDDLVDEGKMVVFLDCDGVLNKWKNSQTPPDELLDRTRIRLIGSYIKSDARIGVVISSAWRCKPEKIDKLRKVCREEGFDLPWIGSTMRLLEESHQDPIERRAREILAFVDQLSCKDRWVALDDLPLQDPLVCAKPLPDDNFVWVDGTKGLLDTHIEQAAYENKEDGVVLWHELNNGSWNITPPPLGNNQSYASCAGNEHDPTKIDLAGFSKGFVTAIEEIDFIPASKDNDKYIDNKFPPTITAIGETCFGKQDVEWVRSTDLNRDDPDALFYMIEPTDLLQGSVGDCWLIASIAGLAEFPEMVKRLFVSGEEISPEGKYEIQLYDMRKSAWVTLAIDDLIPCAKRGWWDKKANPLFAKVCGNELWAILLEKAFARFVGSYSALNGGHTVWAWQCLTGVENQITILKNEETGSFDQYSIDTAKQKREMEAGDRRACPLTRYGNDPTYDSETLFDYLAECDKKKCMMSSGIRSAPGEFEHERDDGLVEGHAYSLLSVVKVGDVKLIQLRNPWGNEKEWNGSWSDNSLTWDEYPDVEAELTPSHKADGMFWMEFGDFIRIFSSVNICPVSDSPLESAERLPTIKPVASDVLEGIFKPKRTNFNLQQGSALAKMLIGACMKPQGK